MRIDFSLRDKPGSIRITCQRNNDPIRWGLSLVLGSDEVANAALGFPVCVAEIEFSGEGYEAALGWLQLVREQIKGEPRADFELDPLRLFTGLPMPFAWFGIKPTLFDAPLRRDRRDREWVAHSFLCYSPSGVATREISAVLGFSWGFVQTSEQVEISDPEQIPSSLWDAHHDLLTDTYADWIFNSGYRAR
jgi:hypothetical protein